MTKQEQLDIVRQAARALTGTLAGDWLDESIDQVASALNSDINPAMWVHGIEEAVAVKTSAKVAEIQATFAKREAALTNRENLLAIKEDNLDRHAEDLSDVVRQASSKLNYIADHL